MTSLVPSWRFACSAGFALSAAAAFSAVAPAVHSQTTVTAPSRPAAASPTARPAARQTPSATVREIGAASVVSPRGYLTYDAFPFSPSFGYPAVNLGFPQPLGHQIVSTGPNGYVYRPVTDLGLFVERGLAALRAADYAQVLVELEPVLAEAPDDGNAWMLQAQALFGLESFARAAESLHMALRLLPQSEWGRPVVKRRDYFATEMEYTARLRALEKHVANYPREGAGHFLLGYHYGYLGHASQAERQLRTALQIMSGDDELAKALLGPLAGASAIPADDKPRPGLPRDEVSAPREF